jgi:hypothetical protein
VAEQADIPRHLDRSAVRDLYGLARVDVDRIFERLPVLALEGSRKVYVRREDLEAHLAQRTFAPGKRVREVA